MTYFLAAMGWLCGAALVFAGLRHEKTAMYLFGCAVVTACSFALVSMIWPAGGGA